MMLNVIVLALLADTLEIRLGLLGHTHIVYKWH